MRGAGTIHAGWNGSEEGGRMERRVVEVTREGEQMTDYEQRSDGYTAVEDQ